MKSCYEFLHNNTEGYYKDFALIHIKHCIDIIFYWHNDMVNPGEEIRLALWHDIYTTYNIFNIFAVKHVCFFLLKVSFLNPKRLSGYKTGHKKRHKRHWNGYRGWNILKLLKYFVHGFATIKKMYIKALQDI